MASLTEVGTYVFVSLLFVNFFLMGFGYVATTGTYTGDLAGDVNYSASSSQKGLLDVSSNTLVADPNSANPLDWILEAIGGTIKPLIDLLNGSLGAFADAADQMNFPEEIKIAVIWPLKIFMYLYSILLIASIGNLIFRGGSSAGI